MASTRHIVSLLAVLFLFTHSSSSFCQSSNYSLVQFVVDEVENIGDMVSVDSIFRMIPEIELVRADFNSRNCILLVESGFPLRKIDVDNALSSLGFSARCFRLTPYDNQPILPIHPVYCRSNATGAQLIRGTGTCCTANATWGCENAACEAAICALDAFCCNTIWDALCAASAVDNANLGGPCAGVSNCPGTGGSSGPCCNGGAGNGTPGCEDANCQNAICALDPFCCNTQWDGVCATAAVDNANQGGACSGASDCPTGSGNPVTASDCNDAIDVCTDINFSIDPNGFGTVNEIPTLGSYGNPDLIPDGTLSSWGTDNWGCLRSGELNSTWMIINIQTGGILEFTFGGLGTQAGFYDWIMYPYDATACSDIANNTVAPIRCNWNAVSTGGTGLATTLPAGGNAGNFEPPLSVTTGDQFVICFSNWSSVTTNVPLEFTGTAIVSCTPLPVELIDFEVVREDQDALLKWSTATESNNDHFILSRSTDGYNWAKITNKPGQGWSNEPTHYQYRDANLTPGVYYFLLQQSDFDGVVKSIGQTVIHIEDFKIRAFPNPGLCNWIISGHPDLATLNFSLKDSRGLDVSADFGWSEDQTTISAPSCVPGLYYLYIRNLNGEVVDVVRLVSF